ncbi:MAG TPA: DUF3822 family protein [Chitinophagaceae bacterium]
MLQPAFHIEHEQTLEEDYLQSLLLMEVNPNGFSYLVLHQVRQEVLDAKYFSLPATESRSLTDRLKTIIDNDDVLHQQFRQSIVLYNVAESVIVPESAFNLEMNRDLVELTYGGVSKGLILSEKVPGHPVYNVYRVPPDMHSLFQQKFTAGKYWHIYSLWLSSLKSFPPEIEEGQARVHVLFYPDKMLVSVLRTGLLQLVQTYTYQVPEDAVYFLLNICRQLELSPEEILLVISGYADNDSALLNEVKKYFLRFHMDEVPQTFSKDLFNPLPVHFFSPLLKMALCV